MQIDQELAEISRKENVKWAWKSLPQRTGFEPTPKGLSWSAVQRFNHSAVGADKKVDGQLLGWI